MTQNYKLILPYAAPYFIYVTIVTVFGDLFSREINHVLCIILVFIALVWAWRFYCPIKGPYSPVISIMFAIPAGIIGAVVWSALLYPFVSPKVVSDWSNDLILLRLISVGALVPIFEELLMRGFILRLVLQWDRARKEEKEPLWFTLNERSVNDVKQGDWSWAAILISTIVFTLGHNMPEWPAAIIYGLLMSFLWVFRKDLLTCIVAHAVTNIALTFYVFQ